MPKITGYVYFNSDRVFNSKVGIPNIPVALQNTSDPSNLIGAIALTNTNGYFEFNNVPSGPYSLIEAYGTSGGLTPPVNYATTNKKMGTITPKDPPITSLKTIPIGTNRIDSLSPNTILLTVTTTDITSNIFYDTPVIDIPAVANDLNIIGPNLITAALSQVFRYLHLLLKFVMCATNIPSMPPLI